MRTTRNGNGQREARRRELAPTVRCPRCRAAAGDKCWSVVSTGRVDYYHQERYGAAEKARADER